MKQLDLILSIVAIVIGFVVAFVLVGTRRTPMAAPSVPKIDVSPVALPTAAPVISNGLPGGGGGGAGRMPGRGGKGGGVVSG